MGRGRIIFTTLGGAAGTATGLRNPRPNSRLRELPVSQGLGLLAWHPPGDRIVAFQTEDLGPLLSAEIGYGSRPEECGGV